MPQPSFSFRRMVRDAFPLTLLAVLAVFSAFPTFAREDNLDSAYSDPRGRWTLDQEGKKLKNNEVHLGFQIGRNNHMSMNSSRVAIVELKGFDAALLNGGSDQVAFTLTRDAGTFTLKGYMEEGEGAGTFTFVPDPSFPDAMAKRGLERPTPAQQFALGLNNGGFALIDALDDN